jgi:hypothetical protein
MRYRSWLLAVLGLVLGGSAACGPQVDLSTLEVTEITSGYYDAGVVADGLYKGDNRLVPSISFRLKNNGSVPVDHVALMVSFWKAGADGELDSKEVSAIGSDDVAPGATTDVILVRSGNGYTLPQARAELFTHSGFVDFTAKVFAKRSGRIVPIGEFAIDRVIIPQSTASR